MDKTPTISSFIIRFVEESPPTAQSPYRGAIRHIQTDEEISFTQWADAILFIEQFVPLEKINSPQPEKKRTKRNP